MGALSICKFSANLFELSGIIIFGVRKIILLFFQPLHPSTLRSLDFLTTPGDEKKYHSPDVCESPNRREDSLILGFPHCGLRSASFCFLRRRKLLILDVNGVLADIVSPAPKGHKADMKIKKLAVFKRPYYLDFLKFCFEKFEVGIWSSRSKNVLEKVIDHLMGDMKHKLLFCWDLSHCTETEFKTLENRHKKLVFKDLANLWEKRHDPNLPWEKGDYNESNTLLLDDSPYKALLNPPHTAIFPHSYKLQNRKDNCLGFGGDIRVYLEELAAAENVQNYIEQNPFGQDAITEQSASWAFYHTVMRSTR